MRKSILIIFLFAFLILPELSLAQDVKLSISASSLTVYTNETTSVDINVTNSQGFQDRFSISVFPQYYYGITATLENYSLVIDPAKSSSLKLYFNIPECSEETSTAFTVTVNSLKDADVKDSKTVVLNTIRQYPVCISDLGLDKYILNPGESVTITTSLKNPASSLSPPLSLQTSVMKNGEIVKRFDDNIETIEGKTTKDIENIFMVGKYESPGSYFIETVLKDQSGTAVSTKKAEFKVATVNASENLNYMIVSKAIKYGVIAQTVEINVRNDGNVPTTSFRISESIPVFMKIFFFPKVEPAFEETKGNRVVYSWAVPSLEPGETYQISYDISTWNAILIALILIAIVAYMFSYVFSVSIIKKHRYTGPITKDKEITVLLEVRNRSRNEIRDVLVRDYAPAVVSVVEKFDTLRPMLRKVAGGTELVWKIDVLRPMDERILTYRIKPVIDIAGTLKLPKSYVRYTDGKKEVRKVLSKGIYIKAAG